MATVSRWHSLAGCLLAAGATGVCYTFSVYSGALKRHFGLTQSQLETVGLSGLPVSFFSFALGMFADKFGPRVSVLLGGLVCAGGYIAQWLVAKSLPHLSPNNAVVLLSGINAVTACGTGFITSAVFALTVRNFPSPRERGSVVGLVKGSVGLCGAFLTQVYVGFIGTPNNAVTTLDYLLAIAVFVLGVTLLPSSWLTVHTVSVDNDDGNCFSSRVLRGYGIEAAVAISCVVAALLPKQLHLAHLLVAVLISLLWALLVPALLARVPLSLSLCTRSDDSNGSTAKETATKQKLASVILVAEGDLHSDEPKHCFEATAREPLLPGHDGDAAAGTVNDGDGRNQIVLPPSIRRTDMLTLTDDISKRDTGAARDPDADDDSESATALLAQLPELTLAQMLSSPECPLLFCSSTFVIGAGYSLTTNLNQICEAAEVTTASVAVTLFSVANAGGRVLAGYITDLASRRAMRKIDAVVGAGASMSVAVQAMHTRPFFFVWVALAMSLGHLLLLLGASTQSGATIYLGVVVAGLAFGWVYPLLVICTGDIFGKAHLGGNYMFYDGYSTVFAAVLLGKVLPEAVYQHHTHAYSASVAHGHAVLVAGNTTASSSSSSSNNSSNSCHGASCFGLMHVVIAVLCCMGALAAAWLAWRTAPIYRIFWRIGNREQKRGVV